MVTAKSQGSSEYEDRLSLVYRVTFDRCDTRKCEHGVELPLESHVVLRAAYASLAMLIAMNPKFPWDYMDSSTLLSSMNLKNKSVGVFVDAEVAW